MNEFLPILTLIIGSVGTLLVNKALSSSRERHEVTLKVIDEFLKMRKAVDEAVGQIATLATSGALDPSEESKIGELRTSVSQLFYTYYDLLPRSSLDDLVCLFYSLGDRKGRVYTVKNGLISALYDDPEIVATMQSISHYRNEKINNLTALKSDTDKVRYNGAISFHARKILFSFSRSLSIENLVDWARHPVKLGLHEPVDLNNQNLPKHMSGFLSRIKNSWP